MINKQKKFEREFRDILACLIVAYGNYEVKNIRYTLLSEYQKELVDNCIFRIKKLMAKTIY